MMEQMNPNKALWEKGDFTRIAQSMRGAGEDLVATLGITPGMRVLDLGCGDGTTAIPEAQMGAEVLGVDIARNLVEAGNRRIAELGLTNCRIQEGDACELVGIADRSFDLVVSIFGAMFAPKPFDVAKEMVRVTKPGGRIVMGNWFAASPTLPAQMFKICASYMPPPPEGFVSPMMWGVPEQVEERFMAAGIPRENIDCTPTDWQFEYQGTPADLMAEFKNSFGPMMNAYEAAEKAGRAEELDREMVALFNSHNLSADPAKTEVRATYMLVKVRV